MFVLRKLGKYTIIIVGGFLALSISLWLILLIYVNANEEELSAKVSSIIEKRTRGDVSIKGLSVGFFRTFPIVSLQLKGVSIRDSLYHRHKMDLLNASDIYLRASIAGIVSRKQPVGKVLIRSGSINLFTDSAGSTNEYVFRSDKGDSSGQSDVSIPDLELQHVNVSMRDLARNKLYSGAIRQFKCNTSKKNSWLTFDVNMKMLAKNVAFNTKSGSYLRQKQVTGKFKLRYNQDKKDLLLNNVGLYIDGDPYTFNGQFNLDKSKSEFNLEISAQDVLYSKVTSILREPLEKKMNEYGISRPIDLNVVVSGKTRGGSHPLINARMAVKNSSVNTPVGSFDVCSFEGTYTNQLDTAKRLSDENSLIHLTNFSGKWENILVNSKNIRISNLIQPFLDCDLASDVELKSLNSLAGSKIFQFLSGKSSINVTFKGPVMGNDSTASNINGEVKIFNAGVKYHPRNFTLSNCSGSLRFVNNDLVVSRLSATTGETKLSMKGSAKNFLSMLDVSPEKLILSWDITSPALHLQDFKSFLSKSASEQASAEKEARFSRTSSKIDKLFQEGDMYISLVTPLMDYKTFTATDVQAKVVLKPTEIAFDKVELRHAGGQMNINGSLQNGAGYNPVVLNARLVNMDIPKLFAAFENFGQDAITHQNLSGKLSAEVNFETAVSNDARLISSENEGTVAFLLESGELNNFEPLIKISEKAFKKQDFTKVQFADLKNSLDVKGTTFIVNEMDIRSTALNLTVEGVYDLKNGTDMSIRLPLTNLTQSQADTDISDDGKAKKGVSLRLRARTGDDGKLKVSWDPFKRSLKNKEEVQDSTGVVKEE